MKPKNPLASPIGCEINVDAIVPPKTINKDGTSTKYARFPNFILKVAKSKHIAMNKSTHAKIVPISVPCSIKNTLQMSKDVRFFKPLIQFNKVSIFETRFRLAITVKIPVFYGINS
jgi:hypothetical protein